MTSLKLLSVSHGRTMVTITVTSLRAQKLTRTDPGHGRPADVEQWADEDGLLHWCVDEKS